MSPFPALDPEPPPQPLWRVALIPSAVVAGIALVVVLILTLTGGSSSKPQSRPASWTTQVAGEVIGWNMSAHTLLAMTPSGGLRAPAVLASHINSFPKTSPSGFGILTSPGHLYYLENRALTPGPPPYLPGSIGVGDVYGNSPIADHDNGLVVGGISPAGKSQSPVFIAVNTSNRHPMPGAPADDVVGDPSTKGAWVTVGSDLRHLAFAFPQQPDSRIEYRTPGKPPVTLATAARLKQLAGITVAHSVELTPYPAPSGRLIAVDVLDTASTAPAPQAIVVLTRTGQVVGKMSAPALRQVTWATTSTDQLLVLRSPRELSTWVPGSSPGPVIQLPTALGGWGRCLFSPTAKYVVCAGFGQTTGVTKWAVLRLADRAVVSEPSHSVPVDWSP